MPAFDTPGVAVESWHPLLSRHCQILLRVQFTAQASRYLEERWLPEKLFSQCSDQQRMARTRPPSLQRSVLSSSIRCNHSPSSPGVNPVTLHSNGLRCQPCTDCKTTVRPDPETQGSHQRPAHFPFQPLKHNSYFHSSLRKQTSSCPQLKWNLNGLWGYHWPGSNFLLTQAPSLAMGLRSRLALATECSLVYKHPSLFWY